MRSAGAAKRQEREAGPPPDEESAVAELRRVIASADAAFGAMRNREAEIAGIAARLQGMAAGCGNADRLAVAADKLSARVALLVIESIGGAAHCAEAREAAEQLARVQAGAAAMREAWIAEGRRREAEERDAQPVPARAPKARHAARRRHLASVPGVPSAVTRAAAAGIVAAGLGGGLVAGMHEESFRHVAVPAARVAWHPMAPDQAAVIPQARWSPSPRPSADVASAKPAPVVTPSAPAPVVTPPVPVPSAPAAAPVPVLDVPRALDLGGSTRGELTLTAGTDAVQWTATATDGITLSQSAGVAVPGEPVVLQVTDGPARGGWIYISFGGTTVPVEVTTDLAPAPPSGL